MLRLSLEGSDQIDIAADADAWQREAKNSEEKGPDDKEGSWKSTPIPYASPRNTSQNFHFSSSQPFDSRPTVTKSFILLEEIQHKDEDTEQGRKSAT